MHYTDIKLYLENMQIDLAKIRSTVEETYDFRLSDAERTAFETLQIRLDEIAEKVYSATILNDMMADIFEKKITECKERER